MVKTIKEYKGILINREDAAFRPFSFDKQIYIGNGQGCHTFWFCNTQKAQKFIDKYIKKIKISNCGSVSGLIPEKLCADCKGHYSYMTEEWKKAKDYNCSALKEKLSF